MARARPLLLLLALTAAVLAAPAAGERAAATQQRLLDKQLLAQVNSLRARHGLHPLRLSRPLSTAATRHSLEMAQRGFFSHTSADGTAFWKRIQRFYPAEGFRSWRVGENLVWESPGLAAGSAIRLWMSSEPHRANLLNPAWRDIGISAVRSEVAPGVYRGLPAVIVTADFGTREQTG